jgi:hypothetical protein
LEEERPLKTNVFSFRFMIRIKRVSMRLLVIAITESLNFKSGSTMKMTKRREEAILPKEIARHLSKFKPEDFEKISDDVVNTALRMIEGKNNLHQNIIMNLQNLPSKQ